MFLHIGGDFTIPMKEVIAIFDLEGTTITRETRDFLKSSEDDGFVRSISADMPKSFIVSKQDGNSVIYLSPISVCTLRKRAEYLNHNL